METETVLHRRYELAELLGEGGMGRVFRAFDTTTQQPVAIKVLRSNGSATSSADLQRFLREGEALRILNHPNIVKVFDAFEDAGRHYLVMEYVEGGSLEGSLRSGARLPLGRVIELGLDLSDALGRAHRLGIVHRDVKPANVLVATDGTPRLSDFGIAYIAGRERLSSETSVVGTLDYLSPEIIRGEAVDARADVWALGVMLFELLAGQPPFRAAHGAATLNAILVASPPDLEVLRPDCPSELVDLIYRMLEKNRAERIPSARQVGASLESLLTQVNPETQTWRRVHAARVEAPASDKTLAAAAADGPAPEQGTQTTPFVGRERELAGLARLMLDPSVQLVTVVGPGGIGKTRLAVEAMREFAHGSGAFAATAGKPARVGRRAFLVELAALVRPELVLSAVAEAIGFEFYPGAEPKAQLIGHLRGRSTLLVLDNFEHLLEAAGLVSELLSAAPNLRVLATSRERLGLSGEHVFALSGLELPATGESKAVRHCSSVRLFVESARRSDHTFELTDAVAPAVADICRLVQGLPLAVVLAAAWSNVLGPAEIAAEIGKSFEFLSSDVKDVPTRQHSLRAVFDYSYGLLREGERAVFARLSVFRGGFTRGSAEAVAGANLKLLASLLNKSLVARDPESGRYRLHVLLHQYAESRLRESDAESERAAEAHAQYHAEFLRTRALGLRGEEPLLVAREIESELDNLRASFAHALETQNLRSLTVLLEGLAAFFTFRSAFTEAEQTFGNASIRLRDPLPEHGSERASVLSRALGHQARACAAQWRHAEAVMLATEALSWVDEPNHPSEAGHLRLERAVSSLWVGEIETGLAEGFRALDLVRGAADHWETSRSLLLFGNVVRSVGDRWETSRALLLFGGLDWLDGAQAEALIRESIELQRTLPKSAVLVADSLMHLGEIVSEQRDYAEGCRLTLEALALAEAQGDAYRALRCLRQLGAAQRRRGDYDAAEDTARRGLALARDGFPFAEPWAQMQVADVLKDRGQLDEAAFHYRAAMAEGNPLYVAVSTFSLGELALLRGESVTGAAMLAESAAGFERLGVNWGVALACSSLANLACAEDRYAEAQNLEQRALRAARAAGRPPHALSVVAGIARRKAQSGESERAVELMTLVERHPLTERHTLLRQVNPTLSELAVTLGEDTFRAATRRGAELALDATLGSLSASG